MKSKTNPQIIYVFPLEVMKTIRRNDAWGKIYIRKINDYESYKSNWSIIKKILE